MKPDSTPAISFDPLSADELKISADEKEECRRWYNENILTAENPAYNFTVRGKSLKSSLSEWDIRIGEESKAGEKYRGGKTTIITLTNEAENHTATVEATIYEETATCRWTVFIKNAGKNNSAVISNFYAADLTLGCDSPQLYFSKASEPAADDFTLYRADPGDGFFEFNADGGRNNAFMPFFNISGKSGGRIITSNWTGQWYTSFRIKPKEVKINIRQEFFSAYLIPGEEVRSPMVTLTFYKGNNPLKGFNSFRKFLLKNIYPENIRPMSGYVIANEFNTKNTEELIAEVNGINPAIMKDIDYFWMDAGWYEYKEGWYDGVGNWTANPSRFPKTLKPLADAMKAKGKGFLLWFEPERVRENTYLYNEGIKHKNRIIKDGDNLMWNLADDGACDYLCECIWRALKTNGATMYRQDFNFTPLPYWEKADREFCDGRQGISENHYVSNLYRYLDYLLENCDDLIIDNCASGGKRLDLEMASRSIPLWRSDYNCANARGALCDDIFEATQNMTYGLSFWMPYSGTNRHFQDEYASRSCIVTHPSVYKPDINEFAKYKDLQNMMAENYYPIGYGEVSTTSCLSFSFGNEDKGFAVIYKRENNTETEFTVRLSSLDTNADYEVTDFDNPGETIIKPGKELMNRGVKTFINTGRRAAVYTYKKI